MATSKNKRKSGKKRQKARVSPQKQAEMRVQNGNAAEEKTDWIYTIGMILMIGGFVGGTFTAYGMIFYALSMLGSLMCVFRIPHETTRQKVTIAAHLFYCVGAVILLVQAIQNR